MPAPDSIKQLVDRFDQQKSSYQSARYNETETRRELISPFFPKTDHHQSLPLVRGFFL